MYGTLVSVPDSPISNGTSCFRERDIPRVSGIIKGGVILAGASFVMWLIFIKPHSYDWQAAGQTQGTVETLMSNSKVI